MGIVLVPLGSAPEYLADEPPVRVEECRVAEGAHDGDARFELVDVALQGSDDVVAREFALANVGHFLEDCNLEDGDEPPIQQGHDQMAWGRWNKEENEHRSRGATDLCFQFLGIELVEVGIVPLLRADLPARPYSASNDRRVSSLQSSPNKDVHSPTRRSAVIHARPQYPRHTSPLSFPCARGRPASRERTARGVGCGVLSRGVPRPPRGASVRHGRAPAARGCVSPAR